MVEFWRWSLIMALQDSLDVHLGHEAATYHPPWAHVCLSDVTSFHFLLVILFHCLLSPVSTTILFVHLVWNVIDSSRHLYLNSSLQFYTWDLGVQRLLLAPLVGCSWSGLWQGSVKNFLMYLSIQILEVSFGTLQIAWAVLTMRLHISVVLAHFQISQIQTHYSIG